MTLPNGTTMGSYEIVAPLGAGGMGEVYRAKDTKLDREVALKILPDAFAHDPERIQRFEREAKVLASLNHPNIAAIYGFDEAEGKRFLIMELVEGDTLTQKLHQGSMPIAEALQIGKQMAEALEAAHERGIIHRDLKPGNIKITPEGKVKVLDFGLAKALLGGVESSQTEMANSPTITADFTRPGVILGTAAYMSPEQARGKPIDKRTDIWSFGCVLYECFGGCRPFQGETTTDLIARILEREPDWETLPAELPPLVKALLQRCLQKDRKDRLRDIGEAWVVLNGVLSGDVSGIALSTRDTRAATPPRARALPWAIAVASAAVSFAALGGYLRFDHAPRALPIRLDVRVDETHPVHTKTGAQFALSPDGTLLAYVTGDGEAQMLHIRHLDQSESRAMSGTRGARHPFFSPDGKWLAFFANGKLKKVSISGGTPLTLCSAPNDRGGTWSIDDVIVFAPTTTSGLLRVPAAGGDPEALTELDEAARERTHRWPYFQRDGKHLIFTSQQIGVDFDSAKIEMLSLDSMTRTVLQHGGSYGRILPGGHVVYAREGTLYAAPLDHDRLELAGTPAPVLEGVKFDTRNGGAQYAFSESGTLIYRAGGSIEVDSSLALFDRDGNESPVIEEVRNYGTPRFSPDGRKLAISIFDPDGAESDIWVHDLDRDTLTRLTFGERKDNHPVWSPDGTTVAFASYREGVMPNLYLKSADGSGEARRLSTAEEPQWPLAFTPDGKYLIYNVWNSETLGDLVVMPLESDEPAKPFLDTPFWEVSADLSPDGRWLAYNSNESGRSEVYVRPFPKAAGKWLISTDGGRFPKWSPDGKELFYIDGQRLMGVPVESRENSFVAGKPQQIASKKFGGPPAARPYDISPDGTRFVVVKNESAEGVVDQNHLTFVFNWFDEVSRMVSGGAGR